MAWAWLKSVLLGITEEDDVGEENRIIDEINKFEEPENTSEEEIGVVTLAQNGIIEINETWVAYEQLNAFKVGSLVTFFKPEHPESNVVTTVRFLENIVPQTKRQDNVTYEGNVSFIDNDKILLTPGSILIWKYDTEVTFCPELGDCVKLECYKGFMKLQPREYKMVTDEILEWNGKEGFLKNYAKISLDTCDGFYTPKVGDIVISCIIPCTGKAYQWRGLNITKVESDNMVSKKIEVSNIPLFVVQIGKEKEIEVIVKNIFFKSLEVIRVQIIPQNIECAILLQNPIVRIEPNVAVIYKILCKGLCLGWTNFKLEFKFQRFVYHKNVKYLTVEDYEDSKENIVKSNYSNRPLNFVDRAHKPNYLRIKPKRYEIPLYLQQICNNVIMDKFDCMSLIQKKLPELGQGLTMNTYALFFHTLLFLEEITQAQAMEELETVAPLVRRGEYYVFIFEEGLNYSNLCPGDTVLISNPWIENDSQPPIEVKIWTRKENEIFLKFKDVFNVISDRGTLFRMKFRNNRNSMIRKHHALDYFLKRIDIKWLFPDLIHRVNNGPYKHRQIKRPSKRIQYFFKELDDEQKDAIENIVFATDNLNYPYLLFGPPGTGKTVTLVETTLQTIRYYPNCRILIAAPSNSAVDTFCEQLVAGSNLSTKDLLRMTSFNYSQLSQLPVSLVKYSALLYSSSDRTEMRSCDVENLDQYKVIAGTLNTLGVINCIGLRSGHFTHVFIDEAGQTTEPETLIPLATMKAGYTRVVFAGDPRQLGPVIMSQIAKTYQLGESLMMRLMAYPVFSRCFEARGSKIKPKTATMLRKNYRSLPNIVNLLSDLFYQNQLESVLSSSSREAAILNKLMKTSFGSSGSSLIMVKVNGEENFIKGEGNSYWNSVEAARVSVIVLELYELGLTAQQIGIITPYSLQVKQIRKCFKSFDVEPPKIGTVEEFQGCERDIIIISLVRTVLEDCKLLFISDPRRANVSLSRAKVMNIIVACENTLRLSNLWKQVLSKVVLTE